MKVEPIARKGFRNRILDRLPRNELSRIKQALTEIDATTRDEIYEPNKPFKHVYFPETAIASVVNVLDDGREFEVATVGYEGMVGLSIFLGAKQTPARAFWQVAGTAFRLDAAFVEKESAMAVRSLPSWRSIRRVLRADCAARHLQSGAQPGTEVRVLAPHDARPGPG